MLYFTVIDKFQVLGNEIIIKLISENKSMPL